MPDSFSRTIPIWAAVLNKVVLQYQQQENGNAVPDITNTLFTPPDCVTDSERKCIEKRVETLANDLMSRGSIDPAWLLRTLKRPLRPYWITTQSLETGGHFPELEPDKFTCLVCVSCSLLVQNPPVWRGASGSDDDCGGYWYTPGAADDHESWARGLTPRLFWSHHDEILQSTPDETERVIDDIVQKYRNENEEWYLDSGHDAALVELPIKEGRVAAQDTMPFSTLGKSGISIGTRRAGRPPDCWANFDAIINVTMMEYDGLASGSDVPLGKYYLQVPVREGKRDKTELEKWLAVTLAFIGINLASNKSVLIHCAQGMDRSVAVAMGAAVLFCNIETLTTDASPNDDEKHLSLHPWCKNATFSNLEAFILERGLQVEDDEEYGFSGMSCSLVQTLIGRRGRDLFFSWIRSCDPSTIKATEGNGQPLATKSSLRLTLNVVQRYHERANPSRKTMQKLNRFFESGAFENSNGSSPSIPNAERLQSSNACKG